MPPRLPFPTPSLFQSCLHQIPKPSLQRPLTSQAFPHQSRPLRSFLRPRVPLSSSSSRTYARYNRFGSPDPSPSPSRYRSPNPGGGGGGGGGGPFSSRLQYLQYKWRSSPPFRYTILFFTLGGVGFYVINLERIPESGRLRFNCVPEWLEKEVGRMGYEQVMREYKGRMLPRGDKRVKYVEEVLGRILEANGLEGRGDWEVRVVDDGGQANAFVLPGGKVFVFTGILPLAHDAPGLAHILSHEISHNLLHHSSERLSRQAIFLPLVILAVSLLDVSGQLASLVLSVIYEWPGSRREESEADKLGLMMMAKSCYEPDGALEMWKRMETEGRRKAGGAPPGWLSTHPSNRDRVKDIEGWLPEARDVVNESACGSMVGFADQFRSAVGHGVFREQGTAQGTEQDFW